MFGGKNFTAPPAFPDFLTIIPHPDHNIRAVKDTMEGRQLLIDWLIALFSSTLFLSNKVVFKAASPSRVNKIYIITVVLSLTIIDSPCGRTCSECRDR